MNRKLTKQNKLSIAGEVLLLLLIVVVACFGMPTFSRYVSNVSGTAGGAIAKPVLNVNFGETNIGFKRGEGKHYTFTVSNADADGITSETSLRYIIKVTPSNTTSALPSRLYRYDAATDEDIAMPAPTITDGVYTYSDSGMSFGLTSATHTYILVMNSETVGTVDFEIEVYAEQID